VRDLWPIERKILEIASAEYPASAEAILQQAATAQVVNFENSGSGFFSDLVVAEEVPLIVEKSPLDSGVASLPGIGYGMGCLVFLKNGRLSMIEGYSQGGEPTENIDFSQTVYTLTPWTKMAL